MRMIDVPPLCFALFFCALKLILLHCKIMYAILCIVIPQQLMHYHCFQATWILIAIFNIISRDRKSVV